MPKRPKCKFIEIIIGIEIIKHKIFHCKRYIFFFIAIFLVIMWQTSFFGSFHQIFRFYFIFFIAFELYFQIISLILMEKKSVKQDYI